jgi:hypothetical protein
METCHKYKWISANGVLASVLKHEYKLYILCVWLPGKTHHIIDTSSHITNHHMPTHSTQRKNFPDTKPTTGLTTDRQVQVQNTAKKTKNKNHNWQRQGSGTFHAQSSPLASPRAARPARLQPSFVSVTSLSAPCPPPPTAGRRPGRPFSPRFGRSSAALSAERRPRNFLPSVARLHLPLVLLPPASIGLSHSPSHDLVVCRSIQWCKFLRK